MGKEARVIAELEDWSGEGKLLLETDELIFRGARRLAIPLSEITGVSEAAGWLVVTHAGGEARFDIGPGFAAKWMTAIQNPRTRIDKFDIKSTSQVVIAGAVEESFAAEVRARTSLVSAVCDPSQEAAVDIVILLADAPAELDRIPELRPCIKSTGAIWVLHPRGRRDLSHDAILAVAKTVGLIDVKSARFNEELGALKLMVPRARR